MSSNDRHTVSNEESISEGISESEPVNSQFPTNDIAPTHPPPQVPFPRRMHPLLRRINQHHVRDSTPQECHNPILDGHIISFFDVAIARGLLGKLGLPLELADNILNYADYRARHRGERFVYKTVSSLASRVNSSAYLYYISPSIQPQTKVHAVVFALRSHDQGWANPPPSDDPYSSSYSWFETSILRPSRTNNNLTDDSLIDSCYDITDDAFPALQEAGYTTVEINGKKAWFVQANVVASKEDRVHIITWARDVEFVRNLREGDRIVVWARAQYPGWENHLKRVEVEIQYEL